MRAADLLIHTLQKLDTKTIFSLSGNQIMPVYDAWIDSDIDLIHVRHEGAAVHMADAWGQLTGLPGVALLTAGPGFANSLSATYAALMAESPVVVLSGHASLATQGRGAFQEMPQAEMASAVAKASWLVRDGNQIGNDLRRAFHIATHGRPGPVHLGLPVDLLAAEVDEAEITSSTPTIEPELGYVDATFVDTMLQAVHAAERPLVLAGPALMRSDAFHNAAASFAEVGLPLIGMESPRGVFDPALRAFSAVLPQADLLILLGKKLDFTLRLGQPPFVSQGTRVLQVDADPAVLALTEDNGRGQLEVLELMHADPADALDKLTQALGRESLDTSDWSAGVAEALELEPPEWKQMCSQEGEALFPAELAYTINEFLADSENSVLIADGGEFGQWIQACVRAPHRIINGSSGLIGNAVPFAIAARLAFPNSRIVACSGDGAFGFHPFEFDTAIRHKLPFIAVVGNDARWNAEYQIQLRNYGQDRAKGVDLLPSDYHEVVQALGGWGQHVTDVGALQQALLAAETSGLAACINATIRGETAPKLGI